MTIAKWWIEIHLREAMEQLASTLAKLSDPEYNEVQLEIDLTHVYNHVNTAWNSRNESDAVIEEHQGPLFYQWRAFPCDIDLGPTRSA